MPTITKLTLFLFLIISSAFCTSYRTISIYENLSYSYSISSNEGTSVSVSPPTGVTSPGISTNKVFEGSGRKDYVINFTPTVPGLYTVYYSISSNGGGSENDIHVTVANTAPTLTQITSISSPMNSMVNKSFTVGDTETVNLSDLKLSAKWSASGVGSGNLSVSGTGASRSISITPAIPNKVYTITYTAKDEFETTNKSFTITSTNSTPEITPIDDISVDVNTQVSKSFDVTDEEIGNISGVSDTAYWSATGVGTGDVAISGTGKTRTVTFTPTVKEVDYTITYKVNDGYLTSTKQFVITSLNNAPSFNSSPITSATLYSLYSYSLSAIDGDDTELTFSSKNVLPNWLTLNTDNPSAVKLTGTPTSADVGTHDIVLQVNDGSVTVEQAFTITITNVAPEFITSADEDATQGQSYSYNIIAMDEENPQVSISSKNDLPSWLTLNSGQKYVSTFAGSGATGFENNSDTLASFNMPFALDFDADGNLYVADYSNNSIRKITPDGTVTTFAGQKSSGSADETGTAASFYRPSGIAVDVDGYVYVSDMSNNKIRKISPAGVVTTFAEVNNPHGIDVDKDSFIYVANKLGNKIHKISPAGDVTVLAGSGSPKSTDGTGAAASFAQPSGVVLDAEGNLYVADQWGYKIRKVTSEGVVTTFAGSGEVGSEDGSGATASFSGPSSLTIDESGNLYVTDINNHLIRKISPTGEVSTLAGSGKTGSENGIGSRASFYRPNGITIDPAGNLYVTDSNNNLIRKLTYGTELYGTPTNDNVGPHNIVLVANDGVVDVEQTFTITVADVNDAPEFTSDPLLSIAQDSEYRYELTARDLDGDTITFSAVAKPSWLNFENGNSLIGTPSNSDVGTHTIKFEATDNIAVGVQSFTITVTNVNDAPEFFTDPVTSATEDEPYIYDFSAIDIDGDALSYSYKRTLPGWLSFDNSADAQELIGGATVTEDGVDNFRFAFNGSTPYVAYVDWSNSQKAEVKKLNDEGTQWITVGTSGFSESGVKDLSLAIIEGVPYVAFTDFANDYKLTVMRFNSAETGWEIVGTAGITDDQSWKNSITGINGVPYVLIYDRNQQGKATVYRLNSLGSDWEVVGNAGFSKGMIEETDINSINGVPYVLFNESEYGTKATLMRLSDDGTNWQYVGTNDISDGRAYELSLAVDGNTPYVTYSDYDNGYYGIVKKLSSDGQIWELVGGSSYTTSHTTNADITINNGVPYVLSMHDGTAKLHKLNALGTGWELVGTPDYNDVYPNDLTLAFSDGYPYIAYANSSTAAVIKIIPGSTLSGTPTNNDVGTHDIILQVSDGTKTVEQPFTITVANVNDAPEFGSTPVTEATEDELYYYDFAVTDIDRDNLSYFTEDSLPSWLTINSDAEALEVVGGANFVENGTGLISFKFNGDTPYVAFKDNGNGNKVTVVKRQADGTGWEYVGTPGFSEGNVEHPSLTFVNGIPYVAFMDYEHSYGLSVMRLNSEGTGWEYVGTPGFNGGSASGIAIVTENNIPYVIFADGSQVGKTTVVKLNDAGSDWEIVGNAGFSESSVSECSIKFSNGAAYALFHDSGKNYKAVLMKLSGDGTTWGAVGNSAVSDSTAYYSSLAFNGETPYVSFRDHHNDGKGIVKKLSDDGGWEVVGGSHYASGSTSHGSLVIHDGIPYVASSYGINGQKVTINRLNVLGTGWEVVGDPELIEGHPMYLEMEFFDGTPYLAYSDGRSGTVVKVVSGSIISGTPSHSDVGTHDIVLKATDGIDTIQQSFTITVANVNDAPEFTSTAITAATEDIVYSYPITGTDIDGDALTITNKSDLPSWLSMENSSNWEEVGTAGFSAGQANFVSLVFDNSTPYVAYQDGSQGFKASVKKYDGANWSDVGTEGFSAGIAGYTSLAFDNSTPYVAYWDGNNRDKATVKKFNGTNWENVGTEGFSAGAARYTSLTFDNSTPYLAYCDGGNSDKVTVMKFDGTTWINVGIEGFSAGGAYYTSLATDNGTPYVAYVDGGNNKKASVMKFDGTNWVDVGTAGFSAGAVFYTALAIDNGTPYVAYRDDANSKKTTVMKFDGTNWINVGTAGFSVGEVGKLSLVIDDGTPYVAYVDGGNSRKATVMKFDGTNWVDVGTEGFSPETVGYPSIAIDNGTPYVAYLDYANDFKTSVMKTIANKTLTGIPGNSDVGTHDITINLDDGNVVTPVEQSFTITVAGVNDASVITSTPVLTATEDIAWNYAVAATDVDNTTLIYSITGEPTGMTIADNVISWTPTEGVLSSGEVTVSVSDGTVATTQKFTVAVTPVNDAPVITSTPVLTATEEVPWSYTVTAADIDSDAATLIYSITGEPSGMTISDNVISWTPIEGVLSSGEVTVSVSDGTAVVTQKFTVAVTPVNDAPVITSTPALAATEDVIWSYRVTAADIDSDAATLIYSITGEPSGMTITGNVISWTPTEGVLNSGEVTLTVSDGIVATTQKFTVVVTPVNDAPVITSTPVLAATEDIAWSYTVTATDIDNALLTYSITGEPTGMTITNNVISWTPTEGVHTSGEVTVSVSDGTAAITQKFTVAVTPVNDAPVITSTPILAATEDVTWSYTVVATDSDNPMLTYTISDEPVGMIITDNVISWTPANGVLSSGEVTVSVSDGTVSVTQTFTTAVLTPVNDAPVISSTPVLTATEDVVWTYTAIATDIDNDAVALVYSISGEPVGMIITDNVISWTPTEGVLSSGEVTVSVSDGTAATTQKFTVLVTPVNDAPVLTAATAQTTPELTPLTMALAMTDASDIDSDILTLVVGDGENYTVEGTTVTPAVNFVGNLIVPVSVSDGTLSSIVVNMTVTVTSTNKAPVLTSVNPLVMMQNVPVTLSTSSFTAEDVDGDALTLIIEPDANATVNGMTVTPVTDFVGTLSLTYSVSDGELLSNKIIQSVVVKATGSNSAPVLDSVLLSEIEKNSTFTLTDSEVFGYDSDDDLLYIAVAEGDNYSVSAGGTDITPDEDYLGTIYVPVTLSDGLALSETKICTVSVFEEVYGFHKGVLEKEVAYKVAVTPNPAPASARSVNFMSQKGNYDALKVTVFDHVGNVMVRNYAEDQGDNFNFTWDLTQYSRSVGGTYVAILTCYKDGKIVSQTKKMIGIVK